MRHPCLATALAAIGLLSTFESTAHALDSNTAGLNGLSPAQREELLRRLSAPPGVNAHFLTSIGFGGGLRLNNPYRLGTQLGSTGESLSTTAPFTMLMAGVTFGAPEGLQHGGFLSLSAALSGIDQAVLTPGYMMLYRGSSRMLGYARLGPAFVLSPKTNVGGELAAGGAYFLTGSFGVTADLSGSLFYGASTWTKKYPAYPVLSMTAGIIVDFEVLP
ncbi:MAG TPA: hypothetical protein PK156_24010 [Polyangium sp.]|nr:hypothetical protein [Polyangium sp.]